jgi:hypothetical protein
MITNPFNKLPQYFSGHIGNNYSVLLLVLPASYMLLLAYGNSLAQNFAERGTPILM